jgi:hypothetical protein
MVAPARFGGSFSNWPSVRGPRNSKPTSLTWACSSDALVFTPEVKIASPRYGSNHTHSDAHSRPALNSWSERTTSLKPLFHGLTVLRHCPHQGRTAIRKTCFRLERNAVSFLFEAVYPHLVCGIPDASKVMTAARSRTKRPSL